MIYEEAIKLLTSQGKFRIELGLERISKVLELLGNPQDKLKCIHVAGTNGKGSVCAICDAILREAGMKTGLYTSPHIFEYTERIKISGTDISKDDFANYVEFVCKTAEKHNIDLTEFEILTVVMFKYFADNNVDVVILETGMGGRFDATNVIESNLCSIITHIDYDHTERLGDTLEKIAFEKAGIIKKGCPVITSEGYSAFKEAADKNDSMLILTAPCTDIGNLSLKGSCQGANLALALEVIRYVFPDISDETINRALPKVVNPFRFQYFPDKNMIIDAAHNPNGIKALRESLDLYYPDVRRRFVFGCLRHKDFKQMISDLFRKDDEIYFYHFDYPNSASVEELRKVCQYPSFEFNSKFDYNDGKLTVVCGSFYMLKELMEKL